jgi:hypothetical protein
MHLANKLMEDVPFPAGKLNRVIYRRPLTETSKPKISFGRRLAQRDRMTLEELTTRLGPPAKARTEVMDAMVKYAASLAAVADAPEQSRAGLEGVAKSINHLGVAAGPYQAAIEGGTEIALELMDIVNRVRAAQQLKKAVVATDPDMQKLAKLLAKDFGSLRRTLELNQKSIKNWMDGPVSSQLDARAALITRAKEKASVLQTNLSGANWADAVATFNKEMAETQKFLADTDKWYLPHQAAVEAAQKQMVERVKLFRDTETAIAQWGKAHADLAEALQNDMTPDWTLLRQSADRSRKASTKLRTRLTRHEHQLQKAQHS